MPVRTLQFYETRIQLTLVFAKRGFRKGQVLGFTVNFLLVLLDLSFCQSSSICHSFFGAKMTGKEIGSLSAPRDRSSEDSDWPSLVHVPIHEPVSATRDGGILMEQP